MIHLVRKYKDEDLKDVISSWENSSKLAHSFLSNEFLDKARYNILNVYLPNADTWMAECKGKVIGFIALICNEVGAIFVDPEIGSYEPNRVSQYRSGQVFDEQSSGASW